MAEALFRRLLGNRKDIEVASAGVHAVRGQPPSMHAVHVCEQEGVDIRALRSQPLTATLADTAMFGASDGARTVSFPPLAFTSRRETVPRCSMMPVNMMIIQDSRFERKGKIKCRKRPGSDGALRF